MNTIELNNQLMHFVNNTENPQSNLLLALEYDKLGHTASAISHYLRCAERTDNKIIKYECLLLIYECFQKQGNRQFTSEYVLKQAISICPNRPEAYYLLSNMLYIQGKFYDAYTMSSIALKICNYISYAPLIHYTLPYVYPYMLYIKAISGIHWEKLNESNNIFEKLYYEYFEIFNENIQSSILEKIHNKKNLLYHKKLNKKIKIVDFFPYFSETGKELLELRINMLKNYVDQFIICESNKTQSGMPLEYTLKDTIKELNLPEGKIKIINLHIPDSSELDIQPIDEMNCIENFNINNNINTKNIDSIRARTRERMQKDSLLTVLDDYDDDTIFIHSDSDEIINPKNIDFIVNVLKHNQDSVISIPLIYLEGKADMRVYYKESGAPKPWYGMFFAMKKHLKINTPTQLRSRMMCTLPIAYLTHDNKFMEDLGWHFSWMGNFNKRKIKYKAFTHHNDKFSFLIHDYNSDEMEEFQKNLSLEEGSMPPSGDTQSILKKIDHKLLPKEIFELPNVKKYLLPE
jgi:hypothetical protein